MIVTLKRGRFGITVEIHAPFTWPDPVTKQPESYLVGFRPPEAEAKARAYVAGNGWRVAG